MGEAKEKRRWGGRIRYAVWFLGANSRKARGIVFHDLPDTQKKQFLP
jgi:hypothetical protein